MTIDGAVIDSLFQSLSGCGPSAEANCCRQLITWIVFTLAQAAVSLEEESEAGKGMLGLAARSVLGEEGQASHLPISATPPKPCVEQPRLELALSSPPSLFLLLHDKFIYSLLMGVL